ncbi:MAG TPA: hypothetical protein P5038_11085 [Candidatus Paceibacterota bacterium]|jgi:hypothetical protein|nr:hypothetical protein [Candidatus Paceibacterota bacterium]
MNDRQREMLKERLRVLANAPLGIQIDTKEHWVINLIKEPRQFFLHLDIILEPNSVLYLEGTKVHPEAATLYLRHPAKQSLDVTVETLFPEPQAYHVQYSPAFISAMLDILQRKPRQELFHHIKGYSLSYLLFTFHDAFEDCLLISDRVPESKVAAFCRNLGATCDRETTKVPSNKMYTDLLDLFEHPDKLKIRVPWWKRMIHEFMSGFRGE